MDILTKEKRSWNMSRIRGKDTKPELIVRSFLHRSGIRFRIHAANLIGRPDIVLPKYKTVIFVHGCFWHCHKGCKYAYIPKSRKKFWSAKFKDNIARFDQVRKKLKKDSWRVVVIWECQVLNNSVKLKNMLKIIKRDNEQYKGRVKKGHTTL
ncbi:MAG: very short patch repair endonuclease [Candidatus Omnitrophica bacterium]|nr:very short patch repair endonuclease [Candidatus Omnitrophota bacterium]